MTLTGLSEEQVREVSGETYADRLLCSMGAGSVESLDISDYEECGIVHDLNLSLDRGNHPTFDIVFDGGSLEHVYNIPVAVANLMRLVRAGGWYAAFSPANGNCGHGFYQFSPEFFFRSFDEANGFEPALGVFSEQTGRRRLYATEDPASARSRVGFNGEGSVYFAFIARRGGPEVPFSAGFPQQSDYRPRWKGVEGPQGGGSAPGAGVRSMLKRILPGPVRRALIQWARARRLRRLSRVGLRQVSRMAEAWILR